MWFTLDFVQSKRLFVSVGNLTFISYCENNILDSVQYLQIRMSLPKTWIQKIDRSAVILNQA